MNQLSKGHARACMLFSAHGAKPVAAYHGAGSAAMSSLLTCNAPVMIWKKHYQSKGKIARLEGNLSACREEGKKCEAETENTDHQLGKDWRRRRVGPPLHAPRTTAGEDNSVRGAVRQSRPWRYESQQKVMLFSRRGGPIVSFCDSS